MLEGFTTVYATCRTPGCGNEGKSIAAFVPALPEPANIICGDCGNPVTEISDTKPTPNTEIPAWLI